MPTHNFDFDKILNVLLRHRVDFIIVGGVAALLHGAPLNTNDLDIVHSRTPENLDRLLAALAELNTTYRERPEKRLKPTLSHLASSGHQLLSTKHGSLDVLGTIGKDLGYDQLLGTSQIVQFSKRRKCRMLNLDTLIAVKQEAGRPKDHAVLPLLRSTLQEKQGQ